MITFQKEKFREIAPLLPKLFCAHHAEVDFENHDIPLNPDWEQYNKLEVAGALHILTARHNGELVGYFFALVWPSLHFAQEISAVSDIFYLDPAYRPGGNGIKLLKEAEKMVKALGATRCYLVTKAATGATMVVRRLGYKKVEHVFFKALNK